MDVKNRFTGASLGEFDVRPGADLRGANLSCAHLMVASLREANLRGADLREANLRSADLRGANLMSADLRNADLRGADLRGANLMNADLRRANLVYADFRRANLSGANLRGATLRLQNYIMLDLQHSEEVNLIGQIYRCSECDCGKSEPGYTDAIISDITVILDARGNAPETVMIMHKGNDYWTGSMSVEELKGRVN